MHIPDPGILSLDLGFVSLNPGFLSTNRRFYEPEPGICSPEAGLFIRKCALVSAAQFKVSVVTPQKIDIKQVGYILEPTLFLCIHRVALKQMLKTSAADSKESKPLAFFPTVKETLQRL